MIKMLEMIIQDFNPDFKKFFNIIISYIDGRPEIITLLENNYGKLRIDMFEKENVISIFNNLCWGNAIKEISLLIEMGFDINCGTDDTGFKNSLDSETTDTTKYLLDNGYKCKSRDDVILFTLRNKQNNVINLLIDYGFTTESCDPKKLEEVFIRTIRKANIDKINFFLQNRIMDINTLNNITSRLDKKYNQLYELMLKNEIDPKIIIYLLSKNGRININMLNII